MDTLWTPLDPRPSRAGALPPARPPTPSPRVLVAVACRRFGPRTPTTRLCRASGARSEWVANPAPPAAPLRRSKAASSPCSTCSLSRCGGRRAVAVCAACTAGNAMRRVVQPTSRASSLHSHTAVTRPVAHGRRHHGDQDAAAVLLRRVFCACSQLTCWVSLTCSVTRRPPALYARRRPSPSLSTGRGVRVGPVHPPDALRRGVPV